MDWVPNGKSWSKRSFLLGTLRSLKSSETWGCDAYSTVHKGRRRLRGYGHSIRRFDLDLDGKYGKLEALLRKAWPKYTAHDARKSARHCRETMRAYEVLGDAASLEMLQEEEKKQKSHRCVVDSADGLLKAKANIALSEKEKKQAEVLVTKREMAKFRAEKDRVYAEEKEAEVRRRLAHRKRKANLMATLVAKAATSATPAEPEAEVEAQPEAEADAAEASRELEALEKEAQKGQLSLSEVVEAVDALQARYGL